MFSSASLEESEVSEGDRVQNQVREAHILIWYWPWLWLDHRLTDDFKKGKTWSSLCFKWPHSYCWGQTQRTQGHSTQVREMAVWIWSSTAGQTVAAFWKKKTGSCHVMMHWFYSVRKRKEERRGSGLGFKVRKDDITTPWNRAFIMVSHQDSQVLERNWV